MYSMCDLCPYVNSHHFPVVSIYIYMIQVVSISTFSVPSYKFVQHHISETTSTSFSSFAPVRPKESTAATTLHQRMKSSAGNVRKELGNIKKRRQQATNLSDVVTDTGAEDDQGTWNCYSSVWWKKVAYISVPGSFPCIRPHTLGEVVVCRSIIIRVV